MPDDTLPLETVIARILERLERAEEHFEQRAETQTTFGDRAHWRGWAAGIRYAMAEVRVYGDAAPEPDTTARKEPA